MRQLLYYFTLIFNYFILYYVVIFAIWQLIQLIGTLLVVFRSRRQEHLLAADSLPASLELIPISIIAPAFNEGPVIIDSVKGMLSLDYPVYEVVVVNDGSTDDTLDRLVREFSLQRISFSARMQVPCSKIRGIYRNPDFPNLTVIDKVNGGKKADACNAGINISRFPYFINMDSDCLLDEDSLFWIARSFMSNKNCVAVGGLMRMSNGNEIKNYRVTRFHMPKKWLARFQILEYNRSFLTGRVVTAKLGCLMVISGAFGAFHKDSVIAIGGYSLNSIGEDMDLVMKLHEYMRKKRRKYQIAFSAKAICWTQGPESYKELRGQRRRWQIGLVQVMYHFRHMMMNPRYGTVGLIGMPYQLLYELCGPLVEILGIIVMPLSFYFHIITPYGLLLFCTAGLQLGILGSIGSLLADVGVFNRTIQPKDFLLLTALCLLDSLFYRPLTVLFRLMAIFGYRKNSHNWEAITRQSFQDTSPEGQG